MDPAKEKKTQVSGWSKDEKMDRHNRHRNRLEQVTQGQKGGYNLIDNRLEG